MRRPALGLRAHLSLLVLLAVVPAFGVIGYTAMSQHRQAAESAQRDAMNLVRFATGEQRRLVTATRQLLVDLSQLPEMRAPATADACNRILAERRKQYSYYSNLGAATLDGRLFCSVLPFSKSVTIVDRAYFRRAVTSREFGIGDYQIGRVTGVATVNFGFPVFDDRKQLRSVVYAALNLGWLEQLIADVELPAGSTLTVFDSRGTVLAHYPATENFVGKSIPDAPLVKTILARRAEGTAEIDGDDNAAWLYAFAPLHDTAAGNVYVAVGIPKAVAFADSNHKFVRNLTLMLMAALLAIIAAWIGGDVFVMRGIRALTDAARRLGYGDLTARTGVTHGKEEIGQLARAFDNMASGMQRMTTTLQRVNRALETLGACNRAMIGATDEQTLLAEVCRIIVNVGGYRFAWIGYAEKDEGKNVDVMAQAGFEGGMESLAAIAKGVTWADAERGHGPVGTAIRTMQPFVSHDLKRDLHFVPWRDEALRRGYASGVAFPLCVKNEPIGALSIYSEETDAFSAQELELLEQAAHDLAFGIATLRARAGHDHALKHLAYYDSLTGLPNRAYFEEHLRRKLVKAREIGQSLALIIIDLNRLWEINDALGFHQGDRLLKEVGERIQGALPDQTLLARMRGDEFAVLLPISDECDAASTAQKILDALAAPFVIGGLDLDMTAAMGVALFPQHGADAARLLRYADVAMHQAKKSGEPFVFYASEQDGDSTRRLAMAGELRRAIENNQLVLHYQPKLDMENGRVCGAEALVRWMHPSRGMVPPDEFISLAEHTGLIKPLTDWVMVEALRQSGLWRDAGLALPISVNLSPRSLQDAKLVERVQRLVAAAGAQAAWLEFEITEGAVMEDPEGALEILRRLSDMGIALFIDDFGTGYSSLSYLKKLPVDAVKIDKSFVIDMLMKADSAAIVRSTISLAHDLNLKVVAEGVENEAMWGLLGRLGCDTAQGFYMSRPLPADKFKEWLDKSADKFRFDEPMVRRRSP